MFEGLTPLMDEKSVYDIMLIWYEEWKTNRLFLVQNKQKLSEKMNEYYKGAVCSVLELDEQNPTNVKIQFMLGQNDFLFINLEKGQSGTVELNKVLVSNPSTKELLQQFLTENKPELETICTTLVQYHQQLLFTFTGSQNHLSYKIEAKTNQFVTYFQDGLENNITYFSPSILFKPEFNRLELKLLTPTKMSDAEIREVLLSLGLKNSIDIPMWITQKL